MNRWMALLTLTGLALLVFCAGEPQLFPACAGAFAMMAPGAVAILGAAGLAGYRVCRLIRPKSR
jgi:hypothetical protein